MFFTILVTCLLSFAVYWWYYTSTIKYKLRWVPTVPGLPFLGNVLDFQDSKEFIHVMFRYLKQFDGMCCIGAFTFTGILSSDYKFLEFLLTTNKILDKSKEYRYLNRWLGTGLLTAPGLKWKGRRKIITPAFHFSILEQFVEVFESNADILIELLEKECNDKPFDIYPFANMCALDIISEAAMGVSINAQKNRHSDYVRAVKEMCRITVERGNNFFRMFEFTYFLTSDYSKEQACLKILHPYTRSVIQAKQKLLKNKKTDENNRIDQDLGRKKKMAFLDLLLQYAADGEQLTEDDISEEVDTFMFEGHDTTSSAIGFTLYNVAKYPDIQNKIVEEQKLLFGSNKNITATHRDLQEMKYLEAVIKESLRLYPPVPFIGRNTENDVQYEDGKIIPGGIDIVVFLYGANRNPKYFKDAEKFDPDRFETMDGTLPYAYVPFSAGPRNCIGQKFAMLEIKSVVSKILRNFEVISGGADLEPIIAAEVVLKSVNGINVKLQKRNW